MAATTWYYKQTERSPALYTVGYGEDDRGRFVQTDSDHSDRESAAARVHYLNGGQRPEAALLNDLKKANHRIRQLCGMVNSFSKRLGLGNKVHAEDFQVCEGN